MTRARDRRRSASAASSRSPRCTKQLSVFENLELALAADRGVRAIAAVAPERRAARPHRRDAHADPPERQAQRTAGLLSHGQKQWLEIGMLLMQDPKLLLLDEPVAGMTDEETERTAELFLSLEGKHSLVVVEHDMKFVELLHARPQESDRAARRQRAGRRHARRRAGQRQGGRGLSGSLNMLQVARHQPVLRRLAHPAQRRLRGARGRGHGGAGAQRRGQDHAAEEPDGRGAGEDRHHRCSMAADITHATPYERVRRGVGYVPQGREIFGRLTVEENLRMGLAYKTGRHARSTASCSSCSRCSSR